MDRWRGRVALVTGASVGIGAAVAVELVRHGMKVVGCARDVAKIQVNVLALSICTREAYQSMKERNVDDGHIININSLCGHKVIPFADLHFYTATKYAVTALTEGLRQELRAENTHIRATSISPGLVATEFISRASTNNPDQVAGIYAAYKALQAKDIASAVTLENLWLNLYSRCHCSFCCPSNPRTRLVFTLKWCD
ncbi:dehydrogenase/reductase SDR family member 11-like isoform X3 [Oreochromis aureus]|uniref:dehydrogenase/reductase SDR family member 11-like isoform X3 n=1 Tax=Oreochromis aureus TaxID=47969 RepID=UPI001954ECB8|nr:dehydrogenase/reductase SDR family member 11-like isoform X3 [Oreochromis aureus]CAI5693209.1 unnamed protein product [Mustela putorius furo]